MRKFTGGEYVKTGKRDARKWRVCREGHNIANNGKVMYKCQRGSLLKHFRSDKLTSYA